MATRNQAAERELKSLANGKQGAPSITVVTLAEFFYGAYKAKDQKGEKRKIIQAITGMQIMDMEESATDKFGELMSILDNAGQKVAERDVMIVAIALANEEQTIVTRNKKDFDRNPKHKSNNLLTRIALKSYKNSSQ